MTEEDAIARMGQSLGPDILAACRELFDVQQRALADAVPQAAADIAYGPHERQVMDLYAPEGASDPAPVLVFVHGGGFVRGDKGGGESWHNANVARMAAKAGLLGVACNYRLAPDHPWPAGAEDVAGVVDWLRAHAADHGGDADRIVLSGSSAGAVHVAGYLQLRGANAGREIAGAILMSGLYGYTDLERHDFEYYGAQEDYAAKAPRDAVLEAEVPLLIGSAQYDPARFQAEFLAIMRDRFERDGIMPQGFIGRGHNHYSLAMHLGTSDRRVWETLLDFIRTCTGEGA